MNCRNLLGVFVLSLLLLALAACGDGGGRHDHGDGGHDHDDDSGMDEEAPDGIETGATCPENSTLTYDNFGKKFMDDFCVRCHSTEVTGDARMGAPSDHNLNTREGIIDSNPEHVGLEAAGGPNGINRTMPEDDPKPTDEQRLKLGEWLACGAP